MKTTMADLNMQEVDLYELLGISVTSTVSEVKKAYRKKALTCHPDKNPDNPRAAELFHQLSKALEILVDESARAAYDKVLNGKKAAKLRHKELDEKRKKLKEDLEARERLASEANAAGKKLDTRTDEEKLQAEIERLRKEGSRQVEEEVELVRQQVLQETQASAVEQPPTSTGLNRLRIKWKANKEDPNNGGYPYDTLLKIMSKYGDIVALVVSPKKNGSALVEFKTKDATDTAFMLEKGFLSNPLTMERLSSDGSKQSSQEPDLNHVPKFVDLTKEEMIRNIPSSNLFPTQPSSHIVGNTMPNYSSAPDFSQLLYANYLGQQLRYQHSVPTHSYQAQPAQMMLPGALMMPGMTGMSSAMSSVMGYGHMPQYSSIPGYGSHLIGLPSYATYPGWPGGHPTAAGSRATYAAGLPVFRGQIPSLSSVPGAHNSYASMAAATPTMFYPQLLAGLSAVIPR